MRQNIYEQHAVKLAKTLEEQKEKNERCVKIDCTEGNSCDYQGHLSAEILGDPYVKMVPLPRIPNYRDLGRRQNPLSVRNSNIAERTQVRKNLNLLNGQAELMTSQ